MRYSPRNIRVACDHKGLTHVGGIHFFHEFLRVLQLRHFLATHLTYPRRNNHYHLSQMILALLYPIVLGLDRLETSSFLRTNGTFQYLTGLPSFPDPQTLRRFLLQAPPRFWEQMHRLNDRLLQTFIHRPEHRSRLIFDLDSTVVTVFGHQDGAEVGYNPRYRGKRSYNPLLCIEANSSYLWDTELRPGNAGTWDGSLELLDTCLVNTPPDIREIRVRADAGFGFNPVFEALESRPTQYAVVARLTQAFRRLLPGLRYESANRDWQIAEFEHRPYGWQKARRFVGGASIRQPRGSRNRSLCHGTLHLSGLGHQSAPHPHRNLAFLRWPRRHGTTDSRTARRFRLAQDSHRILRRECTIPGNRSTGLQPGHRLSANLPRRTLANSHTAKAAIQAIHVTRRAHSPSKSSGTSAQTLAHGSWLAR